MTTVGIDLGGTKVQGVALKGDDVVADAKVATPVGGPRDVVAAIAACVAELGEAAGAVRGVGLGAPGVVDFATGTVVRAPNLPGFGHPVPLSALVAEAVGARVVVDNDVNAAAVAEHRTGAGRGHQDVLVAFVGTGVGGGLVLDGALRRGPGGVAGELGHVVVHDGGRRCGCGQLGHLEAYAGRAGMEKEARRRHADGTPTKLVELAGGKRMKSSVFAKALEAGDPLAIELLDEAVEALGAGLASAAALVDLELVVVGGGMADRLGPAFVGRVEQALRSRLFVPTSTLRVVPALLGDLAGARGAALLVADEG